MVKVAAVQLCSGPDVEANLSAAGAALDQAAAAGATLVVLPENFAFFGQAERDRLAVAEAPDHGPIQAWLARRARELGVWIVGGTLPMRCADPARVRAACLLVDAQGRQRARYDKMHLFDVRIPARDEHYCESAVTEPGEDVVVTDTPAGRLGLGVCYDVRFPELFRHMQRLGMQLASLPAAFTVSTGRAHWETLVRARAIENMSAVVAAAQAGTHPNGRETYGDSMIVDAWGQVLARLPRGTGVIVAEIDADRQRRLRAEFPVLEHRRLDG